MISEVVISVSNSVNRTVNRKSIPFPSLRIARAYARNIQLSWDALKDLFPHDSVNVHIVKHIEKEGDLYV